MKLPFHAIEEWNKVIFHSRHLLAAPVREYELQLDNPIINSHQAIVHYYLPHNFFLIIAKKFHYVEYLSG
jgi:hypothetical protein